MPAPMVAQLRSKVDEATVPVVLGDMATAPAAGTFSLVYLVYNTISNLLSQAEQVACFANAAAHLQAGVRRAVPRQALPQPSPVRLAGRARSDGPARWLRARVAASRLVGVTVYG
jgi:hypothetical protein